MSGAAIDSLHEPSSLRPVGLAKRSDLVVARHVYRSEEYWILKDPIGLKYRRLNEQEYHLLSWLDGKTSLHELCERFNNQFSPHRVTLKEAQAFLGEMHKKSLVVSLNKDQGRHLYDIGLEEKRKELGKKLTNILSIRWRGIDPDAFLSYFSPIGTAFFSKTAVILHLLFSICAGIVLLMNWQEFSAELPTMQGFFQSMFQQKNWLIFGAIIGLTKVLHELGHAFCFKRFGGECHEIGFMLLFFTPTLYCNTSDSWLLPNKWHRAAIGLAGMYVEVFIFSCATFTWWLTEEVELAHYVALNVMIVCSISTLLLNGNPLMKFDGYYVLSDLLEIPNLQQRSNDAIQRFFTVNALGLKDDRDWFTPRDVKRLLITYGLAAYCYRIFLTATIAFILATVLRPVGLKYVGLAVAFPILFFFVAKPFTGLYKRLKKPGTIAMLDQRRTLGATFLCVLFLALLFFPFPFHVVCDFILEARSSTEVRTEQEGSILRAVVSTGQHVEQGDTLIQLDNPELIREHFDLKLKIQELRAKRISALRTLEREGQSSLLEIEKDLQKNEERLEVVNRRVAQLVVKAPCDGVVCSARDRPNQSAADAEDPQPWDGDPLDKDNIHAWLKEQQLVCVIAKDVEMVAILAVPLQDVAFITPQQPVRLLLDGLVQEQLTGTIEVVSSAINDTQELDETLATRSQAQIAQLTASEDPLVTEGQEKGQQGSTKATLLQARVVLEKTPQKRPGMGSGGRAKVYVGNRSIAWRVWRWLLRTLRLKF